ncbi:alpha/beta fold hydrolase [Leifsonia flava]|uniref:Alpha/beta hydrolase n=1 Tax=Orlajensenia leifsoniae TaxID=2561933 RepID=A0A4Y9R7G9_9MICO|nr:alpha/beta hydrolase [Leifsonia flava]TFW00198.1 alpha/beta hydrolase [Leifsonia flava]
MSPDERELPFAVSSLGSASGTPTIVLPGGPCRGAEYLGEFAGLGDAHALVVMHPRGAPQSGGLSRGWWSDADDVVALADSLGLATFDLVGHSAGTRLALSTAARFPERVRSLALVTPPATWLTGTTSDAESIAAERTEPAVLAAFAALEQDDPHTESQFVESFRRQAPACYARWTEVEWAHSRVGEVSLASARAWFNSIPADAPDRIRAMHSPPTLVIGGTQDLLTGVQPVRDYASVLNAQASFIAECGHYPWIEQPEEFHRLLHEWLSTPH